MNSRDCAQSCIKASKQANGTQKYYCKHCKKYQQNTYRYAAYRSVTTANSFIVLHNEGLGVRSMARVLGVSPTTIMRWKLKYAALIHKPVYAALNHYYQMDEMYCYIGSKKNPQWIMYVYDKTKGSVVDFKVGARSKANIKSLVDSVLIQQPKQIGTDGLIMYKNLIRSSIHKVGLNYTRHIERLNLNLRTHLKYLIRRSICFPKSIKMLEASLKLYFWGRLKFS